jgi:hypothetical protein
MLCSDPFVEFLKVQGYCAVRLPKADIKPLQLLARLDGVFDRLGELATVLVAAPAAPPPSIQADLPAASISGRRTGNLSYGLGVTILGDVIGAMGGSKAGLEVSYNQARSIVFEFVDVLEDRVELARLDQYVGEADVSPFSHHVAAMLDADEVYVITSVIKSRTFSVSARDATGIGVPLTVPALQTIVGAEVKVSGADQSADMIRYKGRVPLVFGFQAVRLMYDEGRYTAFKPLKAGSVMRRISAPEPENDFLVADNGFARLRGW